MQRWRRLGAVALVVVAVGSILATPQVTRSKRGTAVTVARPTPNAGDPVSNSDGEATISSRATATPAPANAPCPWLNGATPIPTRVDELLQAMTPLQEATMLHLLQVNSTVPYEGYTPAMPSLCIPEITEQDGAAGVGNGFASPPRSSFRDVTQLPAPIADAAAFDPDLARQYGNVIGAEDAAKGIDMALAPTINIDRSPLWGRSYETLGEDPFLSASLAVPLIQGIQSNRVVSVVKHFAVYNQELNRATMLDDSVVSDRALHEIYLPAFSAATQSGHAGAIMCSYNLINGVPACQNPTLITQILRGDWHFEGFVRSDCDSVYQQAGALSVGVSQVKCTGLYNPMAMAAAVADHRLPRTELDGLARPLLTVLFQFDLIANPHPLTPDGPAATPAHQAIAQRSDDEGAVLLKNKHATLPLDLAHIPSLALIGSTGGTPMPAGQGAMHVRADHPVSAEFALSAVLGARLRYYGGTDPSAAAAVARRSSAAIVVVHDVEAERHDRTSLTLPGNQDALVAAVAAANPRTIVVLETGSAVLMPWINAVPAVLETWYPGETAGTSLVDLISGKVNPSGKLPVSFPASQTPSGMPDDTAATFGGVGGKVMYSDGVDVGYRWYQANNVFPLFAFGYGLSYTTFHFSGLHSSTSSSGSVTVRATITNVGLVAGSDVVQCYLGFPAGSGEAPRQLRGFTRVTLAAKGSTTVTFTISSGDLAMWNSTSGQWVVPGGTYHLFVGDGSDLGNLPLIGAIQIKAAALGVDSGPASPLG